MAVRVSVVIPCYNGMPYVAETLGSVLEQADVELDVIVVDDGSTDGSAACVGGVAAGDARVRLIKQKNAGVAVARNVGVRAMSPHTEYVYFLDADDLLLPGGLALLASCLERDPTLVAAAATCERIDREGNLLAVAPDEFEVRHVESDGSIGVTRGVDRLGYWHMLPMTPILTPGQCLIRRRCLPDGDVFDQMYAPCEDWELWLRLSRVGEIGVLGTPVLRYRDHPEGASKSYQLLRRQRTRVFDRQRSVVLDDERARLQAAWRFGAYGFDGQVCARWARENLVARDVVAAARYAVRSIRYRLRYMWCIVRRRPDVSRPAH